MLRSLPICGVLAAAIVAVGGAAGSGTAWPKPDARDRALLASVLQGMRTDLRSVRLTRLTPEWRGPKRRGNLMLQAVGTGSPGPADTIEAEWYVQLIAGAYDDQCGRKADHCLVAYQARGLGGSEIGRSGAQRPFASIASLRSRIRAAFASVGLHVTSVQVELPYAPAPVVTVRTRHPQRAVRAIRKAETRMPRRDTAGSLIRMLDAHGRVFFVQAGSANHGEAWARPGLKLPWSSPAP